MLTSARHLNVSVILLNKLSHYGIRGHALNWFRNYLSTWRQVTQVNGTTSDACEVNIGVPQGSVLGPLLFLIYVNDVKKCDEHALIRLFADDTNLFVSHKCVDTVKIMAECTLHKLCAWFTANHLTMNIDKTSFNVFSHKNMILKNLTWMEIQYVDLRLPST